MNSAWGVTLPGTSTAPPMMTTSASHPARLGSLRNARATFVRGPSAITVRAPLCSDAARTMRSTARSVVGVVRGRGSLTPRPAAPWKW